LVWRQVPSDVGHRFASQVGTDVGTRRTPQNPQWRKEFPEWL